MAPEIHRDPANFRAAAANMRCFLLQVPIQRVMPSDDRQLLGSRPGVVACGWLSKEGEGAIARAFPSRRFCCLIEGRFSLEYYKEVTTTATSSAHVNEWNLCLHSSAPSGLAVGDVVVKHQGVPLDGRRFVADSTERPTEVTVRVL